ncbi:MAG: hypothetical protein AMJ66_11290 [Betaproteobacteria bacterium SG8_40]|nr:MAG: hypothetical protein AMJ66_11290 [Betaproteobacteria bacterium SG8_40]
MVALARATRRRRHRSSTRCRKRPRRKAGHAGNGSTRCGPFAIALTPPGRRLQVRGTDGAIRTVCTGRRTHEGMGETIRAGKPSLTESRITWRFRVLADRR